MQIRYLREYSRRIVVVFKMKIASFCSERVSPLTPTLPKRWQFCTLQEALFKIGWKKSRQMEDCPLTSTEPAKGGWRGSERLRRARRTGHNRSGRTVFWVAKQTEEHLKIWGFQKRQMETRRQDLVKAQSEPPILLLWKSSSDKDSAVSSLSFSGMHV